MIRTSLLSAAAAGAAAGYYGFPFFSGSRNAGLLLCLFAAVLIVSFFRVLESGKEYLFSDEPPDREPRRAGFRLGDPRRLPQRIGLLALCFSAGFSLGIGAAASVPQNLSLPLPKEGLRGLRGTLLDDPRSSSGGNGMAYLGLDTIQGAGGLRASARGKALVFFPPEHIPALKEFGRKSLIYVEGRFVAAEGPPLFRASAVHVVRPAPGLERFRTGLRLAIAGRFARGGAESGVNWGGMALALLLGIRDDLDTDLSRSYRDAGSSHVLALSGMHLAVLSSIIAFLFRRLLGLKASVALGAAFILLYVFLVGPQPSLLRAAVMYLTGALAIFGGFKREPLSLLNLAFLIQILLWPESGNSLSFILSYLALWGILRAGPLFQGLFRGKVPESLLSPLSASLGAFLATGAVTAAFFGVLRPVGIVAGLLIVPLTTVFMIGSLIWLASGFVLAFAPGIRLLVLDRPLAGMLSVLYRVLERIVSFAARAPGLADTGWVPVLLASLLIFALVWYLERRRRIEAGRLIPRA
ncbi:MAG: ComEC/Rec2 family competence protein [Treponema sp.]|jgi:competence protein ComEC|nr:ComEC/Rec2 family competence protein [Treponema sp.]